MLVRHTERAETTEDLMNQCLDDWAYEARNNEERALAFPLVDKWRDPITWATWYDAIHTRFYYSNIQIRLMQFYYLSIP